MAKPWKIVDLDPSESLKVCLRKIAQTRLQETFAYEHGAIAGEDVEALHDMRVSARRLRAILRIFRDCFPKRKFKKEDEKLQKLIRSLGAVREQDVFIELLMLGRKAVSSKEGQALDLLLAREKAAHVVSKKQMSRYLVALHRGNYTASFERFLKDSL